MDTPRRSARIAAQQPVDYSYRTPHTYVYKRLLREMGDFMDKSYRTEFSKVYSIAEDSVKVQLRHNNKTYIVKRSYDFFTPPSVYCVNDKMFITEFDCCYSPALTSPKWLLMVTTP